MRGVAKRGSLLMAAFAALLLIAVPQVAWAQGAPAQDPQTAQNFRVNDCMKNQQAALMRRAQEEIGTLTKVFGNATIPQLNTQCLTTVWNAFTALGASLTFTNIFAAVWAAIMTQIMNIINSACGQVLASISSLVTFAKSLLCLPLPGLESLNLNLPTFGGGRCNGVSLIELNLSTTGPRPPPPGAWTIWFQPQ